MKIINNHDNISAATVFSQDSLFKKLEGENVTSIAVIFLFGK